MLKSKRSCSKYLVLKTKDIFVIRGRWKYRPVSDILFLAFSEHKKAVYFFALLSLNDSILGPFAFFERSVSVNRSIISVNLILKPKIFFDIILNFQPRYSWIYLNEIFEKKPSEGIGPNLSKLPFLFGRWKWLFSNEIARINVLCWHVSFSAWFIIIKKNPEEFFYLKHRRIQNKKEDFEYWFQIVGF